MSKKIAHTTIQEIYDEYNKLKKQGKFDADIARILGLDKKSLEKILLYCKSRKQ